jgi:hypothetical protein
MMSTGEHHVLMFFCALNGRYGGNFWSKLRTDLDRAPVHTFPPCDCWTANLRNMEMEGAYTCETAAQPVLKYSKTGIFFKVLLEF